MRMNVWIRAKGWASNHVSRLIVAYDSQCRGEHFSIDKLIVVDFIRQNVCGLLTGDVCYVKWSVHLRLHIDREHYNKNNRR